jgi:chorismate dehydratase
MRTLGVVPYLNAIPLIAGLARDARVVEDVPSALSRRLDSGELDAALLPVAEAARGVGDGYLAGHGIASEGKVGSVLLFLRRPLPEVHTLLLDPASRTSAALARHLLAEAGARPATRTGPSPGPDPAHAEEDAVLVIGDAALRHARRWTGDVLDLGEAWTRATRLPFVYARWVARRGLDAEERRRLAARLDQAADEGLPARAALAREWAKARGEDPKAAEDYVLRCVRYRIGPREEEALARFEAIVRAQEAAPVAAEDVRA